MAPTTSAATPLPASVAQRPLVVSHSCGLLLVARASNVPCAPWSPGTGSQRLFGWLGSRGSLVCCDLYPVRPRYQSPKPGTNLLAQTAMLVDAPTSTDRS